jgi:RNA polymerase sigma-70 factor (ECF subfamily)
MSQPISPALERALSELHSSLVSWANTQLSAHEEGEELVQELYVRLLEGRLCVPQQITEALTRKDPLKSTEARLALKRWLFASLRRLAANHRRKLSRQLSALKRLVFDAPARHSSQPIAPLDAEHTLQAWEGATERAEELTRALDQLSARQREVVVLVFEHELSVEEAAEVMGVSVGSARTHYERAKRALRALLPIPEPLHEPPHEPHAPLHHTPYTEEAHS